MLAATLGEWERAEQHFEQALALNGQMDTTTWLVHTEYEYARLLLARGNRDPGRVTALLGEAERLARHIGLEALHRQIKTLGAPITAARLPDDLSAREAQILRLVARGLTNREIGANLFISEHTAASHISHILTKTGCANRTEAASYAHLHAIVDAW
jgi:DNA-binding CsgD family transcriptional regulator